MLSKEQQVELAREIAQHDIDWYRSQLIADGIIEINSSEDNKDAE